MGGQVLDIAPDIQIFKPTVVGGLGTDFGELHGLFTVNKETIGETVHVPELEQGKVQANVGGVQSGVFIEFLAHGVEMFDVIHRWKVALVTSLAINTLSIAAAS